MQESINCCPSNGMYKIGVWINDLAVVIESFGRFKRILGPGIHFLIPIVETPRPFAWVETVMNNGRISDVSFSNARVDTRETLFSFSRQEVYTKDTILLDVNSLMYYKIVDVKKAVYEVDDLHGAIVNVAQTQLKEVFGRMTFQECMTSQDQINEYLFAYRI